MKDPRSWYRLDASIFERDDFEGLSFEAMGLLLFLTLRQWRNGSIPNSTDAIKRIVAARVREFDLSWDQIRQQFGQSADGTLVSPEVEAQRAVADSLRKTRQLAGAQSHHGKSAHDEGNARAPAEQQGADPEHLLSKCSAHARDGDGDGDGDGDERPGTRPPPREGKAVRPAGSIAEPKQGGLEAEATAAYTEPVPIARKPRADGRREGSSAISESSPTKHKQFVDFWCAEFERVKGSVYAFNGGRDGAQVKAILELAAGDLGLAKARALSLLNSTDPFFLKGVDLGTLRSQWNKLGSAGLASNSAGTQPRGAAYQPFVPPDPEA